MCRISERSLTEFLHSLDTNMILTFVTSSRHASRFGGDENVHRIEERAELAAKIEPSAVSPTELLKLVVEALGDIQGELRRSYEVLSHIQTLLAEISAKR